jgi:hypothetical protein
LRVRVATGGGVEVRLAGYVRLAGRRKQKAASGTAKPRDAGLGEFARQRGETRQNALQGIHAGYSMEVSEKAASTRLGGWCPPEPWKLAGARSRVARNGPPA